MASGAGVYKNMAAGASSSDAARTVPRYIMTRIRTAPSPDAVSVEPFGDETALVIKDAEYFKTLVYAHNGWLMEACVVEGGIAGPDDGSRLLPIVSLSFDYPGENLIEASGALEDGKTFRILAALPGKEARP